MKFSVLLASLLILQAFCYTVPYCGRGGSQRSYGYAFGVDDDTSDCNAIIGNYNEIARGRYNLLVGNKNYVDGSANGIFGNKNYVQGCANLVGSGRRC